MVKRTDFDNIDPYLSAVTILEPSGNVAAEVAAEVEKWPDEDAANEGGKLGKAAELLGQFLKGFVVERQRPPATTGLALAQLLPGAWQVQLTYPNGMTGQATVEIYGNGMFRAQGTSPIATFRIDGTWQAIQSDDLLLRGQQSDGYQVTPFNVTIQFSRTMSSRLVGVMSTGERVDWQKIR